MLRKFGPLPSNAPKGFPLSALVALLAMLVGMSGAPARAESGDKLATPQTKSRSAQLAEYFARPMGDIQSLRDQGFGYAEITKILVIARMSRQAITALIARHHEGYGWGTISRELGLNTIDVKRSVDKVRRDLGIITQPQKGIAG